jgi:hypothetical protein
MKNDQGEDVSTLEIKKIFKISLRKDKKNRTDDQLATC